MATLKKLKKKKQETVSHLFFVSQSKVNEFRKCPQAFKYHHIERIERKSKPRPLKFGTIIHKMTEEDAAGRDPFAKLEEIAKTEEKLFREEREAYGEIVKDIEFIMTSYFEYWKSRPSIEQMEYIKIDGRSAEHPFEIELGEDIGCRGTIDAVVKYKKMRWLGEHKSHKTFPNTDHRWRNVQSAVYQKVMSILGWPSVEGILWDYIRSKAPTRPQILKSGEVSSRDLDSLPIVVEDTLRRHAKLNKLPAEWVKRNAAKLVDEQRKRMSTWFQRIATPVKKPVVELIWRDFMATAREMRDTDFTKPVTRNIAKHCDWCQFEPLCRAVMQGSDEDFIKEREYGESTYGVEEEEDGQPA